MDEENELDFFEIVSPQHDSVIANSSSSSKLALLLKEHSATRSPPVLSRVLSPAQHIDDNNQTPVVGSFSRTGRPLLASLSFGSSNFFNATPGSQPIQTQYQNNIHHFNDDAALRTESEEDESILDEDGDYLTFEFS